MDSNKKYFLLKIKAKQYDRLCKLLERDEKNRARARENNRIKRGNNSTPNAYVKPIKFEIVSNEYHPNE